MRGITHSVTNTAIWLTAIGGYQLATSSMQPAPLVIGTILVVGASRLPDIDHPKSAPGRRLDQLMPGFPAWLAKTFGKRRSPAHWGTVPVLVGIALVATAQITIPALWWVGAAIGSSWLLHIIGDCLTWQGAPLFAPFSLRMVRPRYGRRFECGGRFENFVVLPTCVVWCAVAAVTAGYGLIHPFLAALTS
jgi:membrane-bound metal-dependent hydrolase YbcI (DUF457 family)